MKSDQKMKVIKPLGIIGLLSGAAALILIISVGDTFGFPGSVEHMTYETFNRTMAVLLALQTCSVIALHIGQHEVLGKADKPMLTVAIIAWIVMATGTAAEFWLYSDLPYPRTATDFNMRRAAFTLFFLGSVIAGLTLLVLGLRLATSRVLDRLFTVVLMLYLPLFIALFFAGPSIFVVPAVTSIAIAVLALRSKSDPDVLDHKAVKPY